MNLIISKSKNSKSLYIQKSFRKNGKSTSKVVKKLGTMEELLPQHNNSEEEVIAWGKKIAKKMTEEEKRDKDIVLISLSQSKLLEPMKQTSYNGGYLFLQDIFHSLKLDKICRNIQEEYKFEYDLADYQDSYILELSIHQASFLLLGIQKALLNSLHSSFMIFTDHLMFLQKSAIQSRNSFMRIQGML